MRFCPACNPSRRHFLKGAAALAGSCAVPADAATPVPVVDFHAHVLVPFLMPPGLTDQVPVDVQRLHALHLHLRLRQLGQPRRVGAGRTGCAGAVQGVTWGDAAKDLDVHRRVNDHIAGEWVARDPARFLGAFGLPTQDLKLALPELERMGRTPGMRVLQVSSHTADGRYYGDPSLDPLMEALERLGIILFIHPHLQMRSPPLDQYGLFNSVGQGIEEAKVMSNIIMQGVFEKFPRLKILVAHGGGFLPHYGGRMDRNVSNIPSSARNLKLPPSAYLKRFYYDSCVYGTEVLSRLAMAVGADRIVLGGDFPFGLQDPTAEIRGSGFGAADLSAILSGNGTRLLGGS